MSNALIKSTGAMIEAQSSRYDELLGGQVLTKRFVHVAQMAIANPDIAGKLAKIDQTSLAVAVARCATDQLVLDGREAALLTFWNKQAGKYTIAYVPMYQGLIKRILRSPEVKHIFAKVVHEGEEFHCWADETGTHFTHVPVISGTKGPPVAVYASAVLTQGGAQFEVLDRDEVMAIAQTSKKPAQYEPGKGEFWGEWWRKAAVRRLAKYLPLEGDMIASVFEADNATFEGTAEPAEPEPEPEPPKPKPAKRSRAAEIVDAEVVDEAVSEATADDEPPI